MDDSVTAVYPARATNFMEVWVQQELQATTAAPDARVMQLDFKRLEHAEELTHGWDSWSEEWG